MPFLHAAAILWCCAIIVFYAMPLFFAIDYFAFADYLLMLSLLHGHSRFRLIFMLFFFLRLFRHDMPCHFMIDFAFFLAFYLMMIWFLHFDVILMRGYCFALLPRYADAIFLMPCFAAFLFRRLSSLDILEKTDAYAFADDISESFDEHAAFFFSPHTPLLIIFFFFSAPEIYYEMPLFAVTMLFIMIIDFAPLYYWCHTCFDVFAITPPRDQTRPTTHNWWCYADMLMPCCHDITAYAFAAADCWCCLIYACWYAPRFDFTCFFSSLRLIDFHAAAGQLSSYYVIFSFICHLFRRCFYIYAYAITLLRFTPCFSYFFFSLLLLLLDFLHYIALSLMPCWCHRWCCCFRHVFDACCRFLLMPFIFACHYASFSDFLRAIDFLLIIDFFRWLRLPMLCHIYITLTIAGCCCLSSLAIFISRFFLHYAFAEAFLCHFRYFSRCWWCRLLRWHYCHYYYLPALCATLMPILLIHEIYWFLCWFSPCCFISFLDFFAFAFIFIFIFWCCFSDIFAFFWFSLMMLFFRHAHAYFITLMMIIDLFADADDYFRFSADDTRHMLPPFCLIISFYYAIDLPLYADFFACRFHFCRHDFSLWWFSPLICCWCHFLPMLPWCHCAFSLLMFSPLMPHAAFALTPCWLPRFDIDAAMLRWYFFFIYWYTAYYWCWFLFSSPLRLFSDDDAFFHIFFLSFLSFLMHYCYYWYALMMLSLSLLLYHASMMPCFILADYLCHADAMPLDAVFICHAYAFAISFSPALISRRHFFHCWWWFCFRHAAGRFRFRHAMLIAFRFLSIMLMIFIFSSCHWCHADYRAIGHWLSLFFRWLLRLYVDADFLSISLLLMLCRFLFAIFIDWFSPLSMLPTYAIRFIFTISIFAILLPIFSTLLFADSRRWFSLLLMAPRYDTLCRVMRAAMLPLLCAVITPCYTIYSCHAYYAFAECWYAANIAAYLMLIPWCHTRLLFHYFRCWCWYCCHAIDWLMPLRLLFISSLIFIISFSYWFSAAFDYWYAMLPLLSLITFRWYCFHFHADCCCFLYYFAIIWFSFMLFFCFHFLMPLIIYYLFRCCRCHCWYRAICALCDTIMPLLMPLLLMLSCFADFDSQALMFTLCWLFHISFRFHAAWFSDVSSFYALIFSLICWYSFIWWLFAIITPLRCHFRCRLDISYWGIHNIISSCYYAAIIFLWWWCCHYPWWLDYFHDYLMSFSSAIDYFDFSSIFAIWCCYYAITPFSSDYAAYYYWCFAAWCFRWLFSAAFI